MYSLVYAPTLMTLAGPGTSHEGHTEVFLVNNIIENFLKPRRTIIVSIVIIKWNCFACL